jgi:UDP-N-acetylmuramoylalanine--D-glutamate ligase
VAIGEAAPLVREALQGVVPLVTATSMRQAVERGFELALPGGVVVLAPACASFDWFSDYAERGRAFKQEVEDLRKRTSERRVFRPAGKDRESGEQSSVGRRG